VYENYTNQIYFPNKKIEKINQSYSLITISQKKKKNSLITMSEIMLRKPTPSKFQFAKSNPKYTQHTLY